MNETTNTDAIITSAEEHQDQTLQLIESAKQKIYIYSHDLSPRIYNYPTIATALAQFITQNSANRTVKILVHDVQSIVSYDHKILNVCKRLSSNISIHKIAKEHLKHTESFMIVDNKEALLRKDYTRFEGAYIKNAIHTKELLNLFNEIWSHSQTDPNLNRLYI